MDENQQIEGVIFETALRVPPETRKTFLKQACGDNEALYQRVEARLRPQGPDEQGNDQSTLTASEREPGFPCPTAEKAGDHIGRYKLLEKLGEGGMGRVWKAEQVEPVKRVVALKVIKTIFDSEQVLARFAAERQALAVMDHPSIARVLDAGATSNGRPFFLMELVEGSSITQFCESHGLPIREKLRLFVSVCQAVQHAHQKGVVHRDLKPSNVLVATYDGKPVAKIIDFGVAKATKGPLTEETIVTEFGAVVGTLEYMSPEQAEMNQPDIDTRSDIYSLGVMLYELLTGTTPLLREELRRSPLHEALRRIREEEPPKPSTRLGQYRNPITHISAGRRLEVSRLQSVLRGDLDWIVMKCLEKDRTRRYETANAVAMEIGRYLQNEPVLARPPSKAYRVRKLVQRNKLATALVAGVAMALVLGGAVSTWQAVRATKAEHKSSRVAGFLQEMLRGVGPSVARGRDTALLRDILERTAKTVEKDLRSEPEVELEIRDTIGAVYQELGDYTNSEAIFRRNLAMRRALLGERHPDVATSLNNLGIALSAEGKLREAEAAYHEALLLRTKRFGKEHKDVAASLNSLGTVLFDQQRLPQAEDMLRKALAMRKKLFGDEHADVAESLNALSLVLREEGKLAEAETLQRQALAMTRRILGEDHPNVGTSLNNLANILSAQGKFTEAEAMQRQELAFSKRLLGEDHPAIAVSLNNLALVLQGQNKLSEAEVVARQALELRRNTLQPNSADIAVSLGTLASVLLKERKLDEAEAFDREALGIRRKPPIDPDSLAGSLEDLATVLGAQGKWDQAEELSRECLATNEQSQPDTWQTFAAKSRLGGILVHEKKWADAEPLLRDGYAGLKQREAHIPLDDRFRLPEALQSLAELYWSTGRAEEAAKCQEELRVASTHSASRQHR